MDVDDTRYAPEALHTEVFPLVLKIKYLFFCERETWMLMTRVTRQKPSTRMCPLVLEVKYLFFANFSAKSSFSLVFAQGEMSHLKPGCANPRFSSKPRRLAQISVSGLVYQRLIRRLLCSPRERVNAARKKHRFFRREREAMDAEPVSASWMNPKHIVELSCCAPRVRG